MFSLSNKKIILELSSIPPLIWSFGHIFYSFISCFQGTLPSSNYTSIQGGTHQLGPGVEPGWAILIEAVLTTVLVFTVLMAAVNTQTQSKLAPLAIGFAVAVDIMAA